MPQVFWEKSDGLVFHPTFLSVYLSSTICVELCIFRNMAYTFANHPLYKMTQCLQNLELFSAVSPKNVSFATIIE